MMLNKKQKQSSTTTTTTTTKSYNKKRKRLDPYNNGIVYLSKYNDHCCRNCIIVAVITWIEITIILSSISCCYRNHVFFVSSVQLLPKTRIRSDNYYYYYNPNQIHKGIIQSHTIVQNDSHLTDQQLEQQLEQQQQQQQLDTNTAKTTPNKISNTTTTIRQVHIIQEEEEEREDVMKDDTSGLQDQSSSIEKEVGLLTQLQQQQNQQQEQLFLPIQFSLWIPIFNNEKNCYQHRVQQEIYNLNSNNKDTITDTDTDTISLTLAMDELYNDYNELVTLNGTSTGSTSINSSSTGSFDNNPIQQQVLHSLITVLCYNTNIILINETEFQTIIILNDTSTIPNTNTNTNTNTIPTKTTTNIPYDYYFDLYDYCKTKILSTTGTISSESRLSINDTRTNTNTVVGRRLSVIGIIPSRIQIVKNTKTVYYNYNNTNTSTSSSRSSSVNNETVTITNVQPHHTIVNHKTNQVSNSNEETSITLSWTTWTITFPIIQIGDDMYNTNNSNIQDNKVNNIFSTDTISNDSINNTNSLPTATTTITMSSTNTTLNNSIFNNSTTNATSSSSSSTLYNISVSSIFTRIIQSIVDTTITDGTFDKILLESVAIHYLQSSSSSSQQHNSNNNTNNIDIPMLFRYYTSIVQYEYDTYSSIYDKYYIVSTTPAFIVYPLHPIRVWGILLFTCTLLCFIVLLYLSSRRRQSIDTQVKVKFMKQQSQQKNQISDDNKNDVYNENKNNNCTKMLTNSKLSPIDEEIGQWLSSNDTIEEMLNTSFEYYSQSFFSNSTKTCITNNTTGITATTNNNINGINTVTSNNNNMSNNVTQDKTKKRRLNRLRQMCKGIDNALEVNSKEKSDNNSIKNYTKNNNSMISEHIQQQQQEYSSLSTTTEKATTAYTNKIKRTTTTTDMKSNVVNVTPESNHTACTIDLWHDTTGSTSSTNNKYDIPEQNVKCSNETTSTTTATTSGNNRSNINRKHVVKVLDQIIESSNKKCT